MDIFPSRYHFLRGGPPPEVQPLGKKGRGATGPTSSEIYGVAWDQVNDTYTRLGALGSYPLSASPGRLALPIHRSVRSCVANDAGEPVYFLDPTDKTKKEDGSPSNLDGTDGQVCAYFPKFYSRYGFGSGIHSWETSQVQGGGFAVDPAFVKNGVEVDFRLIGTYPGYIDGDGKLSSISGVLPTASKTRAQFRTAAALRGDGWHQLDASLHALFCKLLAIEFADLNSQAMVGNGVTGFAAWPGSIPALTGNSNGIGDASGGVYRAVPKWAASTAYNVGDEIIPNATQNGKVYFCIVAGTSDTTEPTWPTIIGNTVVDGGATWECSYTDQYVSYLGVEHPWGLAWQFMDGLNVKNSAALGSQVWLSRNPDDYADDTDIGYTMVGQAAEADGYGVTLIPNSGLLYPASVGASTVTGSCDYHYTDFDNDPDIGWRVVLVGAPAGNGALAGAFYVNSNNGSTSAATTIAGRLSF